MQKSENIFHKFISKTFAENEINKVNFTNLDNDYSKICLSILLQTFKNHPDANLARQFLEDNQNHSFNKFLLKFKNKMKLPHPKILSTKTQRPMFLAPHTAHSV